MAAFWSPSGSVDALKSLVGNTSDEVSILLILFAIKFIDALSKSMTGDKFSLSVDNSKSTNMDFVLDNSFVSFICDATIRVVSKRKFSPSGKGFAFADVVVVNDVSFPLGLVADVDLTFDMICVPSNSSADIALCINSNL